MKKTIELLKALFKPGLSGIVKTIYIGDPIAIPSSCLPSLIINPVKTESSVADNVRDLHIHYITIGLIIDAKQYLNSTPEKMVGTDFLMTTMENEDSDGSVNSKTILGIIRDNLSLGSNRLIQRANVIDYTVRKRPDDSVTLEATASIQVNCYTNR